jgi:hypothetical protein
LLASALIAGIHAPSSTFHSRLTKSRHVRK